MKKSKRVVRETDQPAASRAAVGMQKNASFDAIAAGSWAERVWVAEGPRLDTVSTEFPVLREDDCQLYRQITMPLFDEMLKPPAPGEAPAEDAQGDSANSPPDPSPPPPVKEPEAALGTRD